MFLPTLVMVDDHKHFILHWNMIHSNRKILFPLLLSMNDAPNRLPYYFMERTNKANQIKLVSHSNVSKSINHQLFFHEFPVGFIFKKQLILFDQLLSCVYIIQVPDMSLPMRDQLLNRINIPYEQFFSCKGFPPFNKHEKYSSNRCDSNISSPIPIKRKAKPSKIKWFVLISYQTLIFSIIGIVFLFYIFLY